VNALIEELRRRARVTFAEYMALALYHPTAGYYTRRRSGAGPVGRQGDFLTAPTASPLFGRTLARLVRDLAAAVGEPITFLELGAGEGILLDHLLGELGEVPGATLGRVIAIEVGGGSRRQIKSRCASAEALGTIEEARRPEGPTVLFASELYDALPAHRVTMRRTNGTLALAEFYVEVGEDNVPRWAVDLPSTPEIAGYLAEHDLGLEEGQVAEIRPAARALHARHLAWCGEQAIAVVIDYGHPSRKLYDSKGRRHGSLVGYRRHAQVADVLQDPGEIDITAHVNFDDLQAGAVDAGWERGELMALGAFLTLHGVFHLLPTAAATGAPLTPQEWAELGEAKRLLLPSGMGSDLRVLAQGKGKLWQAYKELATPAPGEA
jgi:SAM-dependent MidA family methyltransferase